MNNHELTQEGMLDNSRRNQIMETLADFQRLTRDSCEQVSSLNVNVSQTGATRVQIKTTRTLVIPR